VKSESNLKPNAAPQLGAEPLLNRCVECGQADGHGLACPVPKWHSASRGAEPPEDVRRWRMWETPSGLDPRQSPDGPYVLYADHAARIESLARERDRQRDHIKSMTEDRDGFADLYEQAKAENAGLRAKLDELTKLGEDVCWFDWSDNDDDAVRTVDNLRRCIQRQAASQPSNPE
jgi:hypothetical protein